MVIDIISPVYDFKFEDIWHAIKLMGCDYSELYDNLYEYGVKTKNIRTANLMHASGVEAIKQIQEIEPELYEKLLIKFPEIGLFQSFGKKLNYMNGSSWRESVINNIELLSSDNEKRIFKDRIISYILTWKMSGYTINQWEINIIEYLIQLRESDKSILKDPAWSAENISIEKYTKSNGVGKGLIRMQMIPEENPADQLKIIRDENPELNIPYLENYHSGIDSWHLYNKIVLNKDLDFTLGKGTKTFGSKIYVDQKE